MLTLEDERDMLQAKAGESVMCVYVGTLGWWA